MNKLSKVEFRITLPTGSPRFARRSGQAGEIKNYEVAVNIDFSDFKYSSIGKLEFFGT